MRSATSFPLHDVNIRLATVSVYNDRIIERRILYLSCIAIRNFLTSCVSLTFPISSSDGTIT